MLIHKSHIYASVEQLAKIESNMSSLLLIMLIMVQDFRKSVEEIATIGIKFAEQNFGLLKKNLFFLTLGLFQY